MRKNNNKIEKVCEYCSKKYLPGAGQASRQKYCSIHCKWNARDVRMKENGPTDRYVHKGGYNRETHILLWLSAMGLTDIGAYCHYCDEILYSDNFVIEHKVPRLYLTTKKEMLDIDNLVISCSSCNNEKSSTDYNEFINKTNG